MKLSEFINESLGVPMDGALSLYPAKDNINVINGVCISKPLSPQEVDKMYKKYQVAANRLGFKLEMDWMDYKVDFLDEYELSRSTYVMFCCVDGTSYWAAFDNVAGVSKLED